MHRFQRFLSLIEVRGLEPGKEVPNQANEVRMEVPQGARSQGTQGQKTVRYHPQELFGGRQGDFPMETSGGDKEKGRERVGLKPVNQPDGYSLPRACC
jgi:hypothetical protein